MPISFLRLESSTLHASFAPVSFPHAKGICLVKNAHSFSSFLIYRIQMFNTGRVKRIIIRAGNNRIVRISKVDVWMRIGVPRPWRKAPTRVFHGCLLLVDKKVGRQARPFLSPREAQRQLNGNFLSDGRSVFVGLFL